jgi:hypothetical protein
LPVPNGDFPWLGQLNRGYQVGKTWLRDWRTGTLRCHQTWLENFQTRCRFLAGNVSYKWGIQTSAAFYRRIGQMDEFGVVGILVKEGKHIHMEPPKFPVLPKWPFHVPAIQVPPGGKVSSYGISTISVLILRHHVRWCHGKTILSAESAGTQNTCFRRGLTVFNLCAGFSSWLHGWMLVTSGCHFSHWKSAGQLVKAAQARFGRHRPRIQVVPTKTAAPGNVTFVLLRVTLACA